MDTVQLSLTLQNARVNGGPPQDTPVDIVASISLEDARRIRDELCAMWLGPDVA